MIYICGRKVKVLSGNKSQTVNICDEDNIHGKYDYIVRLRPPFISEGTILERGFSSIDDLVRYLERNHFGEVERTPAVRSPGSVHTTPSLPPNVVPPAILKAGPMALAAASSGQIGARPHSLWERDAILAVEQSIDQLLLEFISFPYLHRKEHSVHCELFKILTSRKIFSRTYPMERWVTQAVHKEWPEFVPRPDKGNRRGNFDLSIIAPSRLKSCSFAEFLEGRVRPSVVIEVGLDYDLAHLSADAAKLTNSGIQDSYLVHLVRQDVADDFAALHLFLSGCSIKTAYARLTSSQVFYKLVNDEKISAVQIPLPESII